MTSLLSSRSSTWHRHSLIPLPTAVLLACCLLVPGLGEAQPLWTLVPDSGRSEPKGLGRHTSSSHLLSELGSRTVELDVAADLLESGLERLILTTADGRVVETSRTAFEDRGDGNVMWAGRVADTAHESIVFTLHDGFLIGWFAEPDGQRYLVHSRPDGKGELTVAPSAGEWCHAVAEPAKFLRPLAAGSRAETAGTVSGRDTLDILALYTDVIAKGWGPIGGPVAAIQHHTDFLNMVFRNGAIPIVAKATPVAWAPSLGLPPANEHRRSRVALGWLETMDFDRDLNRHRLDHQADLVHVFAVNRSRPTGAAVAMTSLSAADLLNYDGFGFTTVGFVSSQLVFAHEIGHNLGARHDYENARATRLRPYAYGYTDLTATPHPIHTIMSCGSPSSIQQPFFSSARIRPNGWTIGRRDRIDNERVLRETVNVAKRYSDYTRVLEPGPSDLSARWTDRDTVALEWKNHFVLPEIDTLIDAGGKILAQLDGGFWRVVHEGRIRTLPPGTDLSSESAQIQGLRPGGRYRFSVERSGLELAARSDVLTLEPPPVKAGAPSAPTELEASFPGPYGHLRLQWEDNSHNEQGFEVWFREYSDFSGGRWRRYGERLPPNSRAVWFDEAPGRYGFVVLAYNADGFSTSDLLDQEVTRYSARPPTPPGQIPDCAPKKQLELDGYLVSMCFETPDGARRPAYNYGLEATTSGLLYFYGPDNLEVLVKVLDGCALNGHRWVFVAPVTDLAFTMVIRSPLGKNFWYFNRKGEVAQPVRDTTAFPCVVGNARLALHEWPRDRSSQSTGESTDCVPSGPVVTLGDGYHVSMCYETPTGVVGNARNWGLRSNKSGLLYFFESNNVEVLIKVLDGCGVNGHRWVFVAPVTDLAFNLQVDGPRGERWTHRNRGGETATAKRDTMAFSCT